MICDEWILIDIEEMLPIRQHSNYNLSLSLSLSPQNIKSCPALVLHDSLILYSL